MKTYKIDSKGKIAVPPEAIDLLNSSARQANFGEGLAIFKRRYGFDLIPADEFLRRLNGARYMNQSHSGSPLEPRRLERILCGALSYRTDLDSRRRVNLPGWFREENNVKCSFEATVEECFVRYRRVKETTA